MKKHPELQQGSVQWLEARAGIVTASEAKQLLTDKLAIRKPGSEMPRTLLATKLAEKWLGPLPSFSAWAAEQGNVLEQSAFDCFAFEYDARIERMGFITTDDGRAGCSPDGIVGDDYGVEIKSFQPVHHFKVGMDGGLFGELPEDISAQVHFSMWVTGFDLWKAFFYHRRIPNLLCEVPRDEKIMATIQQCMDEFYGQFDLEWPKWVEKNGGPPPPRKVFVPSSPDDPRNHLFEGLPGARDEVGFIP